MIQDALDIGRVCSSGACVQRSNSCTHLDPHLALEIVLEALQVQLQHGREVAEQVANLGILQRSRDTQHQLQQSLYGCLPHAMHACN